MSYQDEPRRVSLSKKKSISANIDESFSQQKEIKMNINWWKELFVDKEIVKMISLSLEIEREKDSFIFLHRGQNEKDQISPFEIKTDEEIFDK